MKLTSDAFFNFLSKFKGGRNIGKGGPMPPPPKYSPATTCTCTYCTVHACIYISNYALPTVPRSLTLVALLWGLSRCSSSLPSSRCGMNHGELPPVTHSSKHGKTDTHTHTHTHSLEFRRDKHTHTQFRRGTHTHTHYTNSPWFSSRKKVY